MQTDRKFMMINNVTQNGILMRSQFLCIAFNCEYIHGPWIFPLNYSTLKTHLICPKIIIDWTTIFEAIHVQT